MKKELIEKIMYDGGIVKDSPLGRELVKSLEKHLPDFNPYRIDEESFLEIFNDVPYKHIHDVLTKYNSTLPEGLKPLPMEMPEWFNNHKGAWANWVKVIELYGTPEPKPSLPSVDELEKEIKEFEVIRAHQIAQHLHDKYSLKPREWWKDCEKFMHNGLVYKKYSHQVYPDGRTFLHSELSRYDLQNCTPYTITADEIIKKHNLTEEEVRVIREGKC